ncbi:hypothetical protein CKJ79_11160 [Vibrio coralliilyticus]|nr:hypothetical protein CKJ79_11160 [Vibrio coralliilyticus]
MIHAKNNSSDIYRLYYWKIFIFTKQYIMNVFFVFKIRVINLNYDLSIIFISFSLFYLSKLMAKKYQRWLKKS